VLLHASCFDLTGLKWCFSGHAVDTYLFDSRLPFGVSCSCKVCQTITNVIVRMLAKNGIRSIGYIDYFLLVCDGVVAALKCKIDLIHSLGLVVNFHKVAGAFKEDVCFRGRD
jgi:hypothetical protein